MLRRFPAVLLLALAMFAVHAAEDPEWVETRMTPARLAPAAAYTPDDNVVTVEISEYAGYAGLILANGGLNPNPDSVFAKQYGFQLKLTVSEAESWSALNAGHIAAAPSTVDVLAVYGAQLKVAVPLLLGYSRGADGVVVTADVRRINDLKGKTLAACQYTETDFFIRYLAQEASLKVNALASLDAPRAPDALNLVFAADGMGAGDLFARDLAAERNRLDGCVTWEPKTSEVAAGAGDRAKILTTNRNLLIIADVLMVNAGFARAKPEWVAGLVRGALEGNARVRRDPKSAHAVLNAAFGWSAEDADEELSKIHFANWAENNAFFAGQLGTGANFAYLYDTALDVYGTAIARAAAEAGTFPLPAALAAANHDGAFNADPVAIEALGDAQDVDAEHDALLAKNLYFYFEPNSAKLTADRAEDNDKHLDNIRQWLRVAPGSRVLLRGHADGSRLPDFEKESAAAARQARVNLKALSRERCVTLRETLAERFKIPVDRVEIRAVGADEPTGDGPSADRRVEAQWFTME